MSNREHWRMLQDAAREVQQLTLARARDIQARLAGLRGKPRWNYPNAPFVTPTTDEDLKDVVDAPLEAVRVRVERLDARMEKIVRKDAPEETDYDDAVWASYLSVEDALRWIWRVQVSELWSDRQAGTLSALKARWHQASVAIEKELSDSSAQVETEKARELEANAEKKREALFMSTAREYERLATALHGARATWAKEAWRWHALASRLATADGDIHDRWAKRFEDTAYDLFAIGERSDPSALDLFAGSAGSPDRLITGYGEWPWATERPFPNIQAHEDAGVLRMTRILRHPEVVAYFTGDVAGSVRRLRVRVAVKSFIGPLKGNVGHVEGGSAAALEAIANVLDLEEDPKTDEKDKAYRLYSALDLEFRQSGRYRLRLANDIRPDHDIGKELAMELPPDGTFFGAKAEQINDFTVEFAWTFRGRPHLAAELMNAAVKGRESFYIWHTVKGKAWADPKGIHHHIEVSGSRFPSHKLFLDGKEVQRVDQGNVSDLWVLGDLFPHAVK